MYNISIYSYKISIICANEQVPLKVLSSISAMINMRKITLSESKFLLEGEPKFLIQVQTLKGPVMIYLHDVAFYHHKGNRATLTELVEEQENVQRRRVILIDQEIGLKL